MADTLYSTFPPLYGLASTGKIKIWTIAVETHQSISHIIIHHGEENGKQQKTVRKIKTGKNLGRSNETSISEQARLEAQAFWQKKVDKGYTPHRTQLLSTKSKAKSIKNLLPMLALKYEDRKHDVVFPAFVQPKLNGVRCLMERKGDTILFHSRGGKQFTTLDHITHDALKVMKEGDILDGELYCHGSLTFQELVSLIKNDKQKAENAEKLRQYVKFWNYDRCENAPFKVRSRSLKNCGSICHVPTYSAQNESEIMELHSRMVMEGYEGTMIRSGGEEPYRFQYRSPSLLKLKDFMDDEFEIIGAKEGVGKDEGKATFSCVTKDNKQFDVRCKGTDAERRTQWNNRAQYVGKLLSVKFQCYSDSGIPLFPVGIAIRDYE